MLFEGCFGRASLTYAAFTNSSFFFAPPRQIGAPESCMRALKTRVHVAMAGAPAAKRPAGLAFRGVDVHQECIGEVRIEAFWSVLARNQASRKPLLCRTIQ
jgi:hypothetical protein